MEEHEWKFIPRLIVLDSTDEDGFLKSGFALKEKRKVCISNLLFLDFYLYLLEQCDPRWGREIGGIMPSKRLGKSNKKKKKRRRVSFLIVSTGEGGWMENPGNGIVVEALGNDPAGTGDPVHFSEITLSTSFLLLFVV